MGQRIKDLGTVTSTATCDRADADMFKMSTADALELTFSNFEDGDEVTVAVAFTGTSARTLSFSNATVSAVGPLTLGMNTSRTTYATFKAFDGTFVEIAQNSTAAP